MKVLLLVFIIGIFGISQTDAKYESYIKGEEYIGNPDDFGKFVRPCQVYDLNCIRKFFGKHAKCKIVDGPLPSLVKRSQFTIYFSSLNTSVTFTNGELDGFNNTIVEDFYIDKTTKNLVFAIQLRNTVETCPSAYFEFFRRGREPITEVAFAQVTYQALTVTAVFPFHDEIRLDDAEMTLYSEVSRPPFVAEPSVANDLDESVVRALLGLIADEPTAIQELFLTESPFYMNLYIQSNICDFGLKLI